MIMNIYNPYVRQELELYHHGVAGQKWGKKNGPPYPLSASAHSASEKKAGWRKSLDSGGGKGRSKRSTKSKAERVEKAAGKKISRFTPEQKAKAKKIAVTALAVAGAIAITALAGYGAYHGVKALKAAHYAKIGRDYHNAIKNYYTSKSNFDTVYNSFKPDIEAGKPLPKMVDDMINASWNKYNRSRNAANAARAAYAHSRGVKIPNVKIPGVGWR
jgi:hypothetical protein